MPRWQDRHRSARACGCSLAIHALGEVVLVRGAGGGMRLDPFLGAAMAGLAGHAIAQLELRAALGRGHIVGVAVEADLRAGRRWARPSFAAMACEAADCSTLKAREWLSSFSQVRYSFSAHIALGIAARPCHGRRPKRRWPRPGACWPRWRRQRREREAGQRQCRGASRHLARLGLAGAGAGARAGGAAGAAGRAGAAGALPERPWARRSPHR